MDSELQMADAREYILRLHGGLPPLPEPPLPEAPAPPVPAPIEDTADLAAGQLLVLAPGDDAPVAAFHRGWRPGGDVWVAPDDWSTLRWSRGREASWRLESEDEEILRVRPTAVDRMEITLHGAPARLGLLILLVCQVALTDTLPLGAQVGSDGADVGWTLDACFG